MSLSVLSKKQEIDNIYQEIKQSGFDKKKVEISKKIEDLFTDIQSQADFKKNPELKQLEKQLTYIKRFLQFRSEQTEEKDIHLFNSKVNKKFNIIKVLVEKIFPFINKKITNLIFERYASTQRQQNALKIKNKLILELGILNKKVSVYEEQIDASNDKRFIRKKENAIEKLNEIIEKKTIILEKKEDYLKTVQIRKDEADVNVESLKQLGGERIEIQSKRNFTLDGMFFSAEKFREKLKISGATHMTFSTEIQEQKVSFQAISFEAKEWDKRGSLLNTFKEFGILSSIVEVVRWKDRMLLIRREELDRENPLLKESESGEFEVADDKELSIKEAPMETESKGGTVILTLGNTGYYEDTGNDILIHLLQGLNVVTANPPGYAKSKGIPNKETYEAYAEALYDFTKVVTGQEDKKIIFKAMCLSGGAAAKTAAKHPETNLFLDQTYADLPDIAAHKYVTEIGVKKSPLVKAIYKKIIYIFALKLSVSRHIQKNKGFKAIFYVNNDSVMPESQIYKNVKAAFKEKSPNLTLIKSPIGKHGNLWFNIKYNSINEENIAIKQIFAVIEGKKAVFKEIKQDILDLKEKIKIKDSELLQRELKLLKQKKKRLQGEIPIIQSKYEEMVAERKFNFNNEYTLKANHVANQIEHFLEKADLIDPVIKKEVKDKTSLKRGLKKLNKYNRQIKKYKDSKEDIEKLNQYEKKRNQLKKVLKKDHIKLK